NDPNVLFLDEPTTGIDPAGRRTVWRLIESLVEGGTTVLLTTHDMTEAEHLADRVGLLAKGALVAQGSPTALVAEQGGSSRLVVDMSAELDIRDVDGSLAGVGYEVTALDGALVVHDVAPTVIGSIVVDLEDAGLEYDGLSWSEPDLEDVYLELTGESIASG